MKRLTAFLLAVVLVFGLATTAFAASVSPSADKTSVSAGSDVTVTLTLDETIEGVASFQYWLYFDSELFELKNSANGTAHEKMDIGALGTDKKTGRNYYSVGVIDMQSTDEGLTIEAGTLYTLTFTAKEDLTEEQSAAFELVSKGVSNPSWGTIDVPVSNATINVTTTPAEPEPEGNPIESITVSHPNIKEETDPETNVVTLVMNMVVGVVEQLKLDITALLPDADPTQTIVWTSSNSDVVEVDATTGKLTAKAAGEAYITATATDGTATALIDDENQPASATVKVTVAGVADDKFNVTLDAEDMTVSAADAITIPVVIDHETENSTYNAYELEFTYDPAYLTLKTASDNSEGLEFTVQDNDGTVTVRRYGDPKNAGEKAFDLEFTAKQTGTSNVMLTSAKVGTSVEAQKYDVPAAQILDNLTVITVTGYNVQLPEGFTGDEVTDGTEDYTFEAVNKYYDYTVKATINDQEITVTSSEDKTSFTIAKEAITGNIVIEELNRTGKTFDVTVEGNGKDLLKPEGELPTGTDAAQYATPYQFTVTSKGEGYSYAVSVKIGEGEAEIYTPVDGVYTIEGTDITGDITITVTETEPTVDDHTVTITGNGKDDIVGTPAETVAHNGTYTFDLLMAEGYDYEIIAVMSQQEVEVKKAAEANDDGSYTYTIEGITADLTIDITKSNLQVAVSEYVKLKDESSLFLVTATMDLEEDKALAYNSDLMYLKEFKVDEDGNKQWFYSYLVAVSEGQTLTAEAAAELITVETVTDDMKAAQTLALDYNVNGSTNLDINDAQLVYDMYKAVYGADDWETVSVQKFLKGDLNGDKTINVSDAVAVVNEILNPTAG